MFMRIQVLGCIVALALTGCGGGGGGSDASTSASGTVAAVGPSFSPAAGAEQAYFSDSYEFIGGNAFGLRGYVHNAATSDGEMGRTAYAARSGAYSQILGQYSSQLGFLSSSGTFQILDPWLIASTAGILRNGASGSYVLQFGTNDWFDVQGIHEVDLAGKPFNSYLSTAALAGVTGTFPSGAKAYTAVWVAKQAMYLASNLGSVFTRTASERYFLDNYNAASNAYCLSSTRGLVFDSLTHATSYPLVFRSGTFCVVDVTTGAASHSVSSHQAGNVWFFDLTNDQTQQTDFMSDFFGGPGVSTQSFALLVESTTGGQVTEHSDAFVYPAGSQGAYLATSGARLNKLALNAVLSAASLPLVP